MQNVEFNLAMRNVELIQVILQLLGIITQKLV